MRGACPPHLYGWVHAPCRRFSPPRAHHAAHAYRSPSWTRGQSNDEAPDRSIAEWMVSTIFNRSEEGSEDNNNIIREYAIEKIKEATYLSDWMHAQVLVRLRCVLEHHRHVGQHYPCREVAHQPEAMVQCVKC